MRMDMMPTPEPGPNPGGNRYIHVLVIVLSMRLNAPAAGIRRHHRRSLLAEAQQRINLLKIILPRHQLVQERWERHASPGDSPL